MRLREIEQPNTGLVSLILPETAHGHMRNPYSFPYLIDVLRVSNQG
jgi:hypothetical protein